MVDTATVAAQLIDDELGLSGVSRIETETYDWCVEQVVKRLGELEDLSRGAVQYGPDGQVSFMSSDPLAPVQKVLNRYKGPPATG